MTVEVGTYSDAMPKWAGWVSTGTEVVFIDKDGNFSISYPKSEVGDPVEYPEG